MTEPGLYLAKVPSKNWGIYLIDQPMYKYIRLKEIFIHKEVSQELNHFFQSDSDPFHNLWEQKTFLEDEVIFDSSFLFIEFWTNNQDLILNESIKVASILDMELCTDFY